MKELIFATGNQYKADEIQAALPATFNVITMKGAGITADIPEPFQTLEENSKYKAVFLSELLKKNCFAEDTGLEVDALNGEPGVKSARYAGEEKNFDKNVDLLLEKMSGTINRKARFRTVFTLIYDNEIYQFEGICNGSIAEKKSGNGGFGYDPVFLPEESNRTFAEMTLEEKNKYSHRRIGLDKMLQFLKNL
ncbi:MAG: RdgB/HAM1 family non-canonical purine NTP pyrophosphatase [Lacibacter sp.]